MLSFTKCQLFRSLLNSNHLSSTLSRSYTTTELSGTGNPYETKIRRKRHVQDLSIPNFEHVECLKWTNWRMHRDVKRRHMNAYYWQYRNDLKNIAASKSLPSVVRDVAVDDRNATPRDSSVTRLANRCALTSRPRGIYYHFRLSRIVWRDMADHGLVSGAIRAKWN